MARFTVTRGLVRRRILPGPGTFGSGWQGAHRPTVPGMTRELAPRMQRLGTESAFAVLAQAQALEAAGRPVIHLEIGEPDFDTPPHIVEVAARSEERRVGKECRSRWW